MTTTERPAGRSRLADVAQRPRPGPVDLDGERCDLCAAPVTEDHPHLLEVDGPAVRCACRACAILFDRTAAGNGLLRRIPDRRWHLPDTVDDADTWMALGVPVQLAYLVVHDDGGATLHYPGPAGTTHADVGDLAWADFVRHHPCLGGIEPHVEAVLVREQQRRRSSYLVPVDDCFRLIALMRRSWTGFTGGDAVWAAVDEWFEELASRARPAPTD